jgi:protein-S-isoprenylcysteine O-methyltransferase Ste14
LAFLLIAFLVWLISRKEEVELTREFGDEYRDYMKKVPMFVPVKRRTADRFRTRQSGTGGIAL